MSSDGSRKRKRNGSYHDPGRYGSQGLAKSTSISRIEAAMLQPYSDEQDQRDELGSSEDLSSEAEKVIVVASASSTSTTFEEREKERRKREKKKERQRAKERAKEKAGQSTGSSQGIHKSRSDGSIQPSSTRKSDGLHAPPLHKRVSDLTRSASPDAETDSAGSKKKKKRESAPIVLVPSIASSSSRKENDLSQPDSYSSSSTIASPKKKSRPAGLSRLDNEEGFEPATRVKKKSTAAENGKSPSNKALKRALTDVKRIQDAFDELSGAHAALKSSSTTDRRKITNLEAQLVSVRTQRDAAQQHIKNVRDDESELPAAQRSLEEASSRILKLRSEHRAEIASLQDICKETTRNLIIAEGELTRMRDDQAGRIAELEQMLHKSEKAREQEALRAKDEAARMRRYTGMERQLRDAVQELDRIKSELNTDRNFRISGQDKINRDLQKKLEHGDAAYAALEEKSTATIRRLEARLHDASEHLFAAGPDAPASAWGQPTTGDAEEVRALKRQVRFLKGEVDEKRAAARATMEHYKRQQSRQTQAEDDRLRALTDELEGKERIRVMLEKDNQKHLGDLRYARQSQAEAEAETELLRRLQPELETLRLEHAEMQKQIAELEEYKATYIDSNRDLNADRLSYQVAIEKVRTELQQREMQIEDMKREMEGIEHDWAAVNGVDSLHRLKREIMHLRKEVKRLKRSGRNAAHRRTPEAGSRAETEAESAEEGYDGETFSQANIFSFNSDSDMASSPEPEEPLTPPPDNPLANALSDAYAATQVPHALNLKRYERTKPEYEFPPSNRTRRPNGRVPKHKSRVYVRSECHTPYVADEVVSDSDDEFLEWESQAYARTQHDNPSSSAALVNICWNRHILDARGTRVRSRNLQFCSEFARSFAPLIQEKGASDALMAHILQLVKLGQLTQEEGGKVIKVYWQSI